MAVAARSRCLYPAAHVRLGIAFALLSFALPGTVAVGFEDARFSPDQFEFFESKVRPLLVRHCFECHSGRSKSLKGGLRLDDRQLVLKGGDSGASVLPGKPRESLLIKAVRYESVEMPPKGKLAKDQIAILERWIAMGAPWPKEKSAGHRASGGNDYNWLELRESHWAYRPLLKPAPPQLDGGLAAGNQIDHFIQARLRVAGLKPSPPADPRILLRRIYYDLVGLPPTSEETDAFVKQTQADRPSAVRRLVDRLLASPHYGERWGRHWLDVARYSDFDSGNNPLPHAWRYRDWVIQAFNRDLPYNEFVKLQIAGDLISGKNDAVATGFFALGPMYITDGGDPDSIAKQKSETMDDRIDTLSRGFLALTVACARCHDHKFDPIPTLDYYSLAGVFNNTLLGAEWDGKAVNAQKKSGAHVLGEKGSADMRVALRGNLRKPGPVAPRRFLRILSGPRPPRFTKGSGRRELAEAIASSDNPLLARVIVNRVWLHHFGRAIVRTPSNFGTLGDKPTHPLLLEWLVSRFIESGWSLKDLHRTIMASAAYQMSSRLDETSFQLDGDNRLIWRMNPRRLGAESWRDTLLAVTGELDAGVGGQSTENVQSRRRTLYFKVSRNGDRFASDEFLRLFDFPLMRATVAKRPTSIVPQQFLFLMNSPFMSNRASRLANRLQDSAAGNATRIENAYRLLFGRQPSAAEMRIGLSFLHQRDAGRSPMPVVANKENDQDPAKNGRTRWQQYAQVLLSSNELMYVR